MMVKTMRVIAGVLMLAMFVPARASSQSLIGRWARGSEGEARMVFTFRDDGTGSWWMEIPGDQGTTDTFEFTYDADYETDPMAIDIANIDHGSLVGKVLYGVFRFEDGDGVSLDFEIGPPGDDSIRPPDLAGESVAVLQLVVD